VIKLTRDPQIDDPVVGPLIKAVLEEARIIIEREFEERGFGPNRKGRVPAIWKRAAQILRERHGVEWKNPTQLNPGLKVD
jgi:predicted subunit of tRNA(5-methylaminomethyl-2-thiouridylate) methyltransferase